MSHSSDEDAELEACLKSVYDQVLARIQESTGHAQRDLVRAGENLSAMYRLDAPAFLIRKAHEVYDTRLRQVQKRSKDIQRLRVIQGGKV